MGVISAIGNSVAENHGALKAGLCGIKNELSLFPTKYNDLPFGEVAISTQELKVKLNAFEKGVTRTNLLALHAFNEAVADSGLSSSTLNSFDTALIGAS